jgi:aminoglycoside phosphotransferase (APT) family kinase protein/putative sterol carrier protein
VLGRQRDLEQVRQALAAWLRRRMPEASGLEVSALRAPKAGVSNETFLFGIDYRLDGTAKHERLVARLEPRDFLVFPEYDLGRQYEVMARLAGSGVPVPPVRWLERDPATLGGAFYVMDAVDGEVPSEVPSYHVYGWVHDATPERRTRIWWNGVETMARIHALDWRRLGLGFLGEPSSPCDAIDRQLAYWDRYLALVRAEGPPQPILDAGLAWLRANAYTPRRVALCWGDSRMPNMMFRDDRVAAVLDWEMAFLGDPEADLAWWLFLDWANNEGYGGPHLDGIPSAAETRARYAELSGCPVEQAHWNDVFAAFRYGVILGRVGIRMREIGASLPSDDWESNNVCTQALARLLELPPPGEERLTTSVGRRDAGAPVRLQLRLSGEGGSDWYVVILGDEATRHEGVADEADATLEADVADWRAVQAGDLDRLRAFMDGKLRIGGDLTLFMLYEAHITRLSQEA